MFRNPLFIVTSLGLFFALLLVPVGTQGDETVDFQTDVWPILERSCLQCPGPMESFSNLRMDSAERILKGGDLGKILVPGEPENSPMYVRVSLPADDLDLMPVEGDPLTEEEVEVIRKWIAAGADFGGWTQAD